MSIHHKSEPSLYHAELKISPDHRTYRYNYNHADIVTLHQAGQEPLRYRLGRCLPDCKRFQSQLEGNPHAAL